MKKLFTLLFAAVMALSLSFAGKKSSKKKHADKKKAEGEAAKEGAAKETKK
jgi:hypothetical protein